MRFWGGIFTQKKICQFHNSNRCEMPVLDIYKSAAIKIDRVNMWLFTYIKSQHKPCLMLVNIRLLFLVQWPFDITNGIFQDCGDDSFAGYFYCLRLFSHNLDHAICQGPQSGLGNQNFITRPKFNHADFIYIRKVSRVRVSYLTIGSQNNCLWTNYANQDRHGIFLPTFCRNGGRSPRVETRFLTNTTRLLQSLIFGLFLSV